MDRRPALLLGLSLVLAGCVCRRAEISPWPPLLNAPASLSEMAQTVGQRAPRADTLQMQARVVAQGESVLGRRAFDLNFLWRRPDSVRVRLSRQGPGTVFELLQQGGYLTLLFNRERLYFTGPMGTLDPNFTEEVPLDAQALATVPLLNEVFARRLPHLRVAAAPRGSCWRRHLFLRGDPREAQGLWWSGFEEEVWAVRRDTLAVEGLALRLPRAVSEQPLWLWLVVNAHREFDGAVLPAEFTLSLVRRPWHRWRRGEQWSLQAEVTAYRVNPELQARVFELPPPRGVEMHSLRELVVR